MQFSQNQIFGLHILLTEGGIIEHLDFHDEDEPLYHHSDDTLEYQFSQNQIFGLLKVK